MTVNELKTQNPKLKTILSEISDPEIPVLSIMDMGIVRDIEINGKKHFNKNNPHLFRLPSDGYHCNGNKNKIGGRPGTTAP